jgi:UMF1 family MFS transporter
VKSPFLRRPVLSWALYDWANSAFATTVMAGFFPLFFKQYWAAGAEPTVSTFWLGMGNGLASGVVALLAPFLGAVADRGGARVRLLLFFTVIGVAMTAALYWVERGDWPMALRFAIRCCSTWRRNGSSTGCRPTGTRSAISVAGCCSLSTS